MEHTGSSHHHHRRHHHHHHNNNNKSVWARDFFECLGVVCCVGVFFPGPALSPWSRVPVFRVFRGLLTPLTPYLLRLCLCLKLKLSHVVMAASTDHTGAATGRSRAQLWLDGSGYGQTSVHTPANSRPFNCSIKLRGLRISSSLVQSLTGAEQRTSTMEHEGSQGLPRQAVTQSDAKAHATRLAKSTDSTSTTIHPRLDLNAMD